MEDQEHRNQRVDRHAEEKVHFGLISACAPCQYKESSIAHRKIRLTAGLETVEKQNTTFESVAPFFQPTLGRIGLDRFGEL